MPEGETGIEHESGKFPYFTLLFCLSGVGFCAAGVGLSTTLPRRANQLPFMARVVQAFLGGSRFEQPSARIFHHLLCGQNALIV